MMISSWEGGLKVGASRSLNRTIRSVRRRLSGRLPIRGGRLRSTLESEIDQLIAAARLEGYMLCLVERNQKNVVQAPMAAATAPTSPRSRLRRRSQAPRTPKAPPSESGSKLTLRRRRESRLVLRSKSAPRSASGRT